MRGGQSNKQEEGREGRPWLGSRGPGDVTLPYTFGHKCDVSLTPGLSSWPRSAL